MPWLWQLAASLSPQKHRFAPGSVHVKSVADKVALEQVSCQLFNFSLSFHHGSILINLGGFVNRG
jgi:hypothetical protein